MSGAYPEVSQLVPHTDSMRLLDRVLEHAPTHTVCSADAARSALFAADDGSVPSWLALEYIAQCAAVHGGLGARARGEAPRPGLLLGSRRLDLHAGRFRPGSELRVTARHHRGEIGLVAFDGEVHDADGALLADGRVNLYILQDWSELGEARP